MSQNYNITINGSTPNVAHPNQSTLSLSDNGQTKCDPLDTITWKIGQGSGVGRIYSISKDSGSNDLFGPPDSNEPAPQGNSGTGEGQLMQMLHQTPKKIIRYVGILMQIQKLALIVTILKLKLTPNKH